MVSAILRVAQDGRRNRTEGHRETHAEA